MSRTKNAFSEEFLDLMATLDELGSSPEAELAGPWKVLAIEGGFGLYEQWQGTEDEPIAAFQDRAVGLAHMADYCSRSPFALASILLAAGGATLRKAGELLVRVSGEGAS